MLSYLIHAKDYQKCAERSFNNGLEDYQDIYKANKSIGGAL